MVAEPIPCYISNNNTGSVVSFSVEIPDTVNDTYSTSFENQTTKGRSSPFKAYQSSGPRSVSFAVTLSYDYRRDIKETVNALRSMLKPVDAGYILAPRVHVRIGDVLNIEAVPTSFTVTWREGYKNSTYRICDCEFAFDEVEDVGTFATSDSYQGEVANIRDKEKVEEASGNANSIGDNIDLDLSMGYDSPSGAQFMTGTVHDVPAGSYTIMNKYKDCVQVKVGEYMYWVKL